MSGLYTVQAAHKTMYRSNAGGTNNALSKGNTQSIVTQSMSYQLQLGYFTSITFMKCVFMQNLRFYRSDHV